MDDPGWFEVTATSPDGEEQSAADHRWLQDAFHAWVRWVPDLAWIGPVRVWHCTDDDPAERQLVLCSTIGRTVETALTPYGRMLTADPSPTAYRLIPDPRALTPGDHHFVVRRLDDVDDGVLYRCVLTIDADAGWRLGIQAVTGDGRAAGSAMEVAGDLTDPALAGLAVVAGATPIARRPPGPTPN